MPAGSVRWGKETRGHMVGGLAGNAKIRQAQKTAQLIPELRGILLLLLSCAIIKLLN